MRSILDKKNKKYFNEDFPVFYKNASGKSAIDTALEKNQIRSVNLMIDYIVEYQDSYFYAHLFQHNIVQLLKKGVEMADLFDSHIFNHTFDFDEWPSVNANTKKMFAPYNRSMFSLRHHYAEVFPKIYKKDLKNEKKRKKIAEKNGVSPAKERVFKIKY